MNSNRPALQLLLSDAHGIYLPQIFVQNFLGGGHGRVSGVDVDSVAVVGAGPDTLDYWDAWGNILNNFRYTTPDGDTFGLWQDGDLWLVCYERITEEEATSIGIDTVGQ